MGATGPQISLFRGGSLQRGIASVALVTTAVVLLAACLAFVLQQWASERLALAESNRALAAMLAPHAAEELLENEPGEARHLISTLADAPGVRAAFMLAPDGRLMAAASRRGARTDQPPSRSDPVTQVRAPMIDAAGRNRGEIVIVSDVRDLTPIVARYLAVSSALFFAATGLAIFMSQWLATRLIRPVDALSRLMVDLAEGGDPTRRAPPVGDAVFARLSDSFNALMDKLGAGEQALRHTNADLIVARDAAEAANVLKSQFLANMSHEIRTPLNGVLAMAQIMEMSALDAGQRERLGVIRYSGEALLAVLNDVLDLSKIEAGKLELDPVAFDVGGLTRELAAATAAMAAEKGLAFVLDVQPSAEGVRRGDAGRLRQIAGNLLSNAVKFTSAGEVRLTLAGLGEDGAQGLMLSVQDTGMGVPTEKMSTLFDKFTQADSSATRRFGGTGLGLAICRELATLMGGRITVRSEVGRGSLFRVELPLPRVGEAAPAESAPEAPAVPAAPEAVPDAAAVRVLAAEDNATNQRVLRAVLDTFGVELTMVENGRQAVEAWASGAFDVVLMDIQMPEMDGVEAAKAIRAAERQGSRPRTPIVALSANAMTHQVAEYLAAGMDAHVAKPIEIPKLRAALEAALEGAESVSRAA